MMNRLTPSSFRWVNTCQRRVWRDIHINRALRDELPLYVQSRMNAGVQHEEKIHQVAAPQSIPVLALNWPNFIRLTQQLMEKRAKLIMNAALELNFTNPISQEPVTLGGRIDRLERQPNGLYAPVEVKMYSKVHDNDELQLAFYVWMLCQLQNVKTLPAAFWLGKNEDGTPKNIVPFRYNQQAFEEHLHAALGVISNPEPQVQLIPECHGCHWYSTCHPEASSKKHITLLSGLRKTTLEDFAKAGIQTLNQIVTMQPEDLRQFRGIKTTAHGFHASARALLEDRAIWYGSLHPLCKTPPIYFDIETIPYQKPVWSIGWAEENKPVQVVIVDPIRKSKTLVLPSGEIITLVPDPDSAWRFFAKAVSTTDAPIFHWSPFDATNLRTAAPIEVKNALLPRLHDLCKSFDHAVKLPIKGKSLKTVGVHLGFAWRGYDDWWDAYVDYQKWLNHHDLKALKSACTYQQDDVTAMMIVRRWLAENVPNELL